MFQPLFVRNSFSHRGILLEFGYVAHMQYQSSDNMDESEPLVLEVHKHLGVPQVVTNIGHQRIASGLTKNIKQKLKLSLILVSQCAQIADLRENLIVKFSKKFSPGNLIVKVSKLSCFQLATKQRFSRNKNNKLLRVP